MARIESAEVGIEIAYGIWSGHEIVVGGVLWGVGGRGELEQTLPTSPTLPPSHSACDKISQFTTPSQITKFRTQTYSGRSWKLHKSSPAHQISRESWWTVCCKLCSELG